MCEPAHPSFATTVEPDGCQRQETQCGDSSPKEFQVSALAQAQHDAKAEAAARDYRQQRIVDNAKKAAAAASAAAAKEAEDAKKQARIDREIENDLLATPGISPYNYGDSEDKDVAAHNDGLGAATTWRRINGGLARGDHSPAGARGQQHSAVSTSEAASTVSGNVIGEILRTCALLAFCYFYL